MEFFRLIDRIVSEQIIQNKVTPKTISEYAETMLFVNGSDDNFEGLTLWGEFNISYNKIKGGVRFTLTNCPYAFNWTITHGFKPDREKIVLHCTINRAEIKDEFLEEINEFLDEWQEGLENNFN
ncbi:MAG: hypothetical protein HKO92_10085 [Flavobacteriaceae bacterium]|nr:hypothetical protein [Flavobacteriaceae bacterium]